MSGFFVVKMEWEFGEQYGNVLFPEDLSDVQNKIDELDNHWC